MHFLVISFCLIILFLSPSEGRSEQRIAKPSDFFVAKYDTTGNQLWSNTYDFAAMDNMHCAFATRDGRLIFTGSSDCIESQDGFRVVCIANDGNILWSNCSRAEYGIESSFCFRGQVLENDRISLIGEKWSLLLTNDGEKISSSVSGTATFSSAAEFGNGEVVIAGGYSESPLRDVPDGFVIKLDNSNRVLWNYTFGREYWDWLYDVCVAPDGTVCAVGESYTGDPTTTGPGALILLLNQQGEILREIYWDTGRGLKYIDVQAAPDGGFLLFGNTSSRESLKVDELNFTKISTTGDSLWSRTKGSGWEAAAPVDAFGKSEYPFLDYIRAAARFEPSHMIGAQAYIDIICTPYLETATGIDSVKLHGSYFGLTSDGFYLAGTRLLNQ